MTADEKMAKLEAAIALINEADALMQAALGADDEVYYIHTQLENAADDIQAQVDTLRALRMQNIIA